MHKLLMAFMVAGMGLFATGCPQSDATENGNGEETTANGGGESAVAEGNGAPTVESVPSRATPVGTVMLLVEAVRSGDFAAAAEFCVDGSAGQESLRQAANSLEQASSKPTIDQSTLQFMVQVFSQGYGDASAELVEESGSYALVMLRRGDPLPDVELPLNQVDGQWEIDAPKNIISGG